MYYDPVHGYVELDDTMLMVRRPFQPPPASPHPGIMGRLCRVHGRDRCLTCRPVAPVASAAQFMDTPQVQRLRDLRQLGASFLVFPGASHDRFSHSVGVSFVSGRMVELLRTKQPELEITAEEMQAVRVAGLTHDLGHGCFSHVFENEFLPRVWQGSGWNHEDMGLRMVDALVDDNGLDVDREWVESVKGMIVGRAPPGQRRRKFLYEIVNNERNGIDTDKFDYLARDSRQVGLASSFDSTRLLGTARVIGGEICYHAKEVFTLHELLHTRYSLFKQIYTHRATKAVEYMLADILVDADAAWGGRLRRACEDPALYLHVTDAVLREVEGARAECPAMERAQALALRLRRRQLYRFVDELVLDEELQRVMPEGGVTPEHITAHSRTPGLDLRPDDVIVHNLKLNFGSKRNPIERTRFYRERGATSSFTIDSGKVSHIIPREFEERVLRVYSRSGDPAVVSAVQRAFRRFLRSFSAKVSRSPDHSSRLFSPSKAGRAAPREEGGAEEEEEDSDAGPRTRRRLRLRAGENDDGDEEAEEAEEEVEEDGGAGGRAGRHRRRGRSGHARPVRFEAAADLDESAVSAAAFPDQPGVGRARVLSQLLASGASQAEGPAARRVPMSSLMATCATDVVIASGESRGSGYLEPLVVGNVSDEDEPLAVGPQRIEEEEEDEGDDDEDGDVGGGGADDETAARSGPRRAHGTGASSSSSSAAGAGATSADADAAAAGPGGQGGEVEEEEEELDETESPMGPGARRKRRAEKRAREPQPAAAAAQEAAPAQATRAVQRRRPPAAATAAAPARVRTAGSAGSGSLTLQKRVNPFTLASRASRR